ncbi:MAG: TetR/AcrR family transcriptional regulator [Galactobacter sp.]
MEAPENREHLETALQNRLLPIMQRLLSQVSPDATTTEHKSDLAAPPHSALPPHGQPPIQLLGAHLLGLGIARYVLHLSPIADLPRQVIADDVAATVRRYLPA